MPTRTSPSSNRPGQNSRSYSRLVPSTQAVRKAETFELTILSVECRFTLSRIVEIVDSPSRFGFMYATTALHVEQGQERFVIDFDPASGLVSYLIEAVSVPGPSSGWSQGASFSGQRERACVMPVSTKGSMIAYPAAFG